MQQLSAALGQPVHTKWTLIPGYAALPGERDTPNVGAAVDMLVLFFSRFVMAYSASSFSALVAALHAVPATDVHYAYAFNSLPRVLSAPDAWRSWARRLAMCVGCGHASCLSPASPGLRSKSRPRAALLYNFEEIRGRPTPQVTVIPAKEGYCQGFPVLAPRWMSHVPLAQWKGLEAKQIGHHATVPVDAGARVGRNDVGGCWVSSSVGPVGAASEGSG